MQRLFTKNVTKSLIFTHDYCLFHTVFYENVTKYIVMSMSMEKLYYKLNFKRRETY